jgi:hypothetical protein
VYRDKLSPDEFGEVTVKAKMWSRRTSPEFDGDVDLHATEVVVEHHVKANGYNRPAQHEGIFTARRTSFCDTSIDDF